MDPGFGQLFGDRDLLVAPEDNSGLLFAIAQGDVMDTDLLWEVDGLKYLLIVVPGTGEPLVGLPSLLHVTSWICAG